MDAYTQDRHYLNINTVKEFFTLQIKIFILVILKMKNKKDLVKNSILILKILIYKGIYLFKNGERYEGQFMDCKKEGLGSYYYINGD